MSKELVFQVGHRLQACGNWGGNQIIMNRQELEIKLKELNIPEDSYSLYGGVDILKTILEWGIKWRIHEIDERGNDCEIATFNTEEEACDYFLKIMEKQSEVMKESYKTEHVPKKEAKKTFIVSENGFINHVLLDKANK